MTSLCSQRSTSVPANGPNRTFGSVATRNTKPAASADPVVISTSTARATWWRRSPNSETSWPVHSAAKELLRASRTYGCWRTRSASSGAGRGRAGGAGMASGMDSSGSGTRAGVAVPGVGPPSISGRSRAALSASAGESPVWAGPGRTRNGASSSARGRSVAANRKKARPAVRKTSPTDATFRITGNGIGMMSLKGPRWSRKLASSCGGRMMWIADWTSDGSKPAISRLGCQIGM